MVVPTPESESFADAEPEVEATQERGISDDLNMIETLTLFADGVRWNVLEVSGTMGISTDDSQRYLDELVDDGWIEIVNRSKDPDETVYQATAAALDGTKTEPFPAKGAEWKRAAKVLQLFSGETDQWSVTGVSDVLKITPAEARCSLETLTEEGVVEIISASESESAEVLYRLSTDSFKM